MIASSVSRRCFHVCRWAVSPTRIVPSAPRISPTWASSSTAMWLGTGGVFLSVTGAGFSPATPLGGHQALEKVVYRNRSDQAILCVCHPHRYQVEVSHVQRDIFQVGIQWNTASDDLRQLGYGVGRIAADHVG